jgi:hypothetical protein
MSDVILPLGLAGAAVALALVVLASTLDYFLAARSRDSGS